MKKFLTWTMLASLIFVQPARADWAYMPHDEMISHSDAIAIVTIQKVEKSATVIDHDGSPFAPTYHQEASATVERVLKGKLPNVITLYGAINAPGGPFLCVPDASLKAGRCLVFLRDPGKKGESWVSANADRGIRPIMHEQVEWLWTCNSKAKPTKLSELLTYINAKLKKTVDNGLSGRPKSLDSFLKGSSDTYSGYDAIHAPLLRRPRP